MSYSESVEVSAISVRWSCNNYKGISLLLLSDKVLSEIGTIWATSDA